MTLKEIGNQALKAKKEIAPLSTDQKNKALLAAGKAILNHSKEILAANEKDMALAKEKGMAKSLQDRLLLTPQRLEGIVEGMEEVVRLEDPIGSIDHMTKRPNGLLIGKKRVPLGVVGVIYEARPNVTADVFALCFKTGNATILKGGKDAFYSNQAIVNAIREALEEEGINPDSLQLIEDNRRETTREFMKMNDVLDVLIPRGGAGLIQSTVENATVPVIETGTGNCHLYVDQSADQDQAIDILINGKTQRVGVCNALESLLVHQDIAAEFLPKAAKALKEHNVEIRAEEKLLSNLEGAVLATEEDWGKEYLDYIISVKAVRDVDEAIDHINTYSTGHSEAIVTKDYQNAQKFLDQVDSAAVYANASTRFTDGNEFGYGAEIGISTQKLHARGPMGLEALTTTKFVIYGDGQIRS